MGSSYQMDKSKAKTNQTTGIFLCRIGWSIGKQRI